MKVNHFTTKRIVLCGIFLALALIVSLIENALPPIIPALPYAKIGFGNIVLLACFILLGPIEGFIVLALRCLLAAVFAGNISSIIWSLPAALAAYIIMILFYKLKIFSITGVSMLGGMVHNTIQILVATLVIGESCFVYLPYMLVAGGLAGLVTGIVCHFIVNALDKKINIPQIKHEEYYREERSN